MLRSRQLQTSPDSGKQCFYHEAHGDRQAKAKPSPTQGRTQHETVWPEELMGIHAELEAQEKEQMEEQARAKREKKRKAPGEQESEPPTKAQKPTKTQKPTATVGSKNARVQKEDEDRNVA
ncbi:hypothetical protein CC80DRAFT_549229 [Byssothecium circinans]|uniref:Uncharacterized protein n=1 Tax=Byssothecium circinans TaxID=147558 RepID=A0A6A5TU60_9PLEO|nr:hypothetical protein CC80DRAFT_549229 [Byssothecium circinans]